VRPYIKKPFTKIGLVEWLKAPSSSPSTEKKKKKPKTLNSRRKNYLGTGQSDAKKLKLLQPETDVDLMDLSIRF
jgi:hypothetical protein